MRSRGRRSSRPSADEREEAILVGAERLLQERPLAAVSIEDLAAAAGLSRPAFYFYFSSKDEVLLTLLARVIAEVQQRVAALPRDFAEDPVTAWREAIGAFVDVFTTHRAVAAAAAEARGRSAAIHELWSDSMRTWVGYAADAIAAERTRGAAPANVDAGELATALTLMNERVLAAAFTDESPRIDRDRVLDVLTGVWVPAVYGRTPPGPSGPHR